MNIKKQVSSIAAVCGLAMAGIVFAEYVQINDFCQYEKGQAKCKCYQSQADYYEDEMRKGYTAKQYDNLEEHRKYFRDKAFNCKSN